MKDPAHFSKTERRLHQCSKCRIGTWNVVSLALHMVLVIDFAVAQRLDILCMQEVRLSGDNLLSAQALARKHHWHLHVSDPVFDASGRVTSGVGFLARWPLKVFDNPPLIIPDEYAESFPPGTLDCGRVIWAKVHRPGTRPFELVNMYLHAADSTAANALGKAVMLTAAARGEDRILLGDWNRTPFQEPAAPALASGCMRAADDLVGLETIQSTRSLHAGRYIDYALYQGNVVLTSREQHTHLSGCFDHDLIVYELASQAIEPVYRMPSAPPIRETEKVTADLWDAVWENEHQCFHDAIAAKDADAAWKSLSRAAETALGVESKHLGLRASPSCPVQAPLQHQASPDPESVPLRKLKRFHRRLEQFHRSVAEPALARKIKRQAVALARAYPPLENLDVYADASLIKVADLIRDLRTDAGSRRIHAWMHKMENDDQAFFKWVKSAGAHDACKSCPDDDTSPCHPQQRADQIAADLHKLWRNGVRKDVADLALFMAWIPNGGFHCDEIHMHALALVKAVRKAAHTASSTDAWKADHWLLLPLAFFEKLAQVWQLVLDGASLPEAWLHIRCVLIPKPDGSGLRPLSIAALAWRAGATVILQQLVPWIETWAHSGIVGGLKGRSAEEIHDLLQSAICNALQTGTPLSGCKLDLKKCFDFVHSQQGIDVLVSFGLPQNVAKALGEFYTLQRRWIQHDNCMAKDAIAPLNSLLQGCPFSCLILAGLMTVWVQEVTSKVPEAQIGIFVDDRTIWTEHAEPDAILDRVMDAAAVVDDAMGWQLHPDKGEMFATRPRERKALLRLVRRIGPVNNQFKLLGVRYNTTRAHRTPQESKWQPLVKARLRRLATASRSFFRRAKAVRSLVIPCFAFTGAWTRPPKRTITAWQNSIERAVTGGIFTSRSRFLTWTARLGRSLDPQFALDFACLRHELWRCKRNAAGRTVPANSPARLHEVCTAWNWQQLSLGRFRTQHGILDLSWDGKAEIARQARIGWETSLWKSEPRAADRATQQASRHAHPCFQGHFDWIHGGGGKTVLATALAAAYDHRLYEKVLQHPIVCMCGMADPTRRHLAWSCPHFEHPYNLRLPRTGAEEGLLVPLVRLPPLLPDRPAALVVDISNALRAAQSAPGLPVLCATDGGSASLELPTDLSVRRAGYGIAFASFTHGDTVPGVDQTSFAAENWAIYMLSVAARDAAVPVIVAIDNTGTVGCTQKALAGQHLFAHAAALWNAVRTNLPSGSAVFWVPSHDKKEDWAPPQWLQAEGLTAERVRYLNDQADIKASDHARSALRGLRTYNVAVQCAIEWEHAALRRMHHSAVTLREHLNFDAAILHSQH